MFCFLLTNIILNVLRDDFEPFSTLFEINPKNAQSNTLVKECGAES